MRNFIETRIPRIRLFNGKLKPFSIDQRNGTHCVHVITSEPQSTIDDAQVSAYKNALIDLAVPEPDIETQIAYLRDPIARAKRDKSLAQQGENPLVQALDPEQVLGISLQAVESAVAGVKILNHGKNSRLAKLNTTALVFSDPKS